MSRFIDLSHVVYDGMPGLSLACPDGSVRQGTAHVGSWLNRDEMSEILKGQASFEVSELSLLPAPIGTYIDSPFNRFPDGRDISELTLDDLILPGLTLDLRDHPVAEPVPPSALPENENIDGTALLFNFGWDRYWGSTAPAAYPYVSTELAIRAADRGASLLGFDTGNADGPGHLGHPVHTELLCRDVLIVENLTRLETLHGKRFRFFAVPLKVQDMASMPMRAFAEVLE